MEELAQLKVEVGDGEAEIRMAAVIYDYDGELCYLTSQQAS